MGEATVFGVKRLPWCFAFQDGVEDGEKLSGSCGEGDHFGLADCNEALVEEF